MTAKCTHLISNEKEVEKETKKIKDAIEKKVPIVDEQWLIDSESVDVLADVKSYLLDTSSLSLKNTTEGKVVPKEIKSKAEKQPEKVPEKKNTKKVTIKAIFLFLFLFFYFYFLFYCIFNIF